MFKFPYCPTYEEMLYPSKVDKTIRLEAENAIKNNDEFDPINLFNITWKNSNDKVNKLVLPKSITGVDANIVVLLGKYFPSGSHKVGPSYSAIIEDYIDKKITSGNETLVSPSTGNFGIGSGYVAKLLNLKSLVVMPKNMSKERADRMNKYGSNIEYTDGSVTGVISTLYKTRELCDKNKDYISLAQFESFSNYRFHRYVTGNSAIDACKDIGNGKIACFTCAPGSGGTIAAGDQIKSVYKDAVIAALEPYECPTLALGTNGNHKIEGVGDKIVNLIHNISNTDYVVRIKSDDCIKGLEVFYYNSSLLEELGIDKDTIDLLRNIFGISGICNILGAIKMAKLLNLKEDDNIVTIATDSMDRYYSVLDKFNKEYSEKIDNNTYKKWFNDIFLGADTRDIIKLDNIEKNRLYNQKENDWLQFGYTKGYLDSLKQKEVWEKEYSKVEYYDKQIINIRK